MKAMIEISKRIVKLGHNCTIACLSKLGAYTSYQLYSHRSYQLKGFPIESMRKVNMLHILTGGVMR